MKLNNVSFGKLSEIINNIINNLKLGCVYKII